MINISDDERRRAFSTWLRSGVLPTVRQADGTELKFNPWHDPKNGRFAFVGAGQYHGRWRGGGFTGGGGGSVGGGGATGPGWEAPQRKARQSTINGSIDAKNSRAHGAKTSGASAAGGSAGEPLRTVVRNGYTYEIDARARTRRVSGSLTLAPVSVRSRTSQRQAGGSERRSSDDGGHYIAARFNGPTEAFNHFAQDANFNRGKYRLLENEWAGEKRAGRTVTVSIVPQFGGNSSRPSTIDVRWIVNGNAKSVKFPNERWEKRRDGK